ncbi:MAG: nicotinate-nucleotide adenylyltransferase [Anaerolineaceae bacterium]|nr:nicotinate-nucleotide adenylyltransferase [Anaerolineaceae bacterium]
MIVSEMRIGIFGGTFDPPHIAHLVLAMEAHFQLKLELVLWVLTPKPPHKQKRVITPSDLRAQMVKAATASNSAFELSEIEINRSGPHYSIETLRLLAERYPGAKLFFLIGEDSLRELPTWYQPDELLRICAGLGVMRRPREEVDLDILEDRLAGIRDKIFYIDTPLLEISSTEIRKRIIQEKPFRYYVPHGVYQLIKETGSYKTD